jgi:hypothetical protein
MGAMIQTPLQHCQHIWNLIKTKAARKQTRIKTLKNLQLH